MPLGPGFTAMFKVSEDVDPFTSSPDCSSGTCLWDFVNLNGWCEFEFGSAGRPDGDRVVVQRQRVPDAVEGPAGLVN